MKEILNGVVAPMGFTANGINAGIRKGKTKNDLTLIKSSVLANVAGVFTSNLVKAAPIYVCMKHLENGKGQAIVANSGNANTCNADGIYIAEETCKIVAKNLNVKEEDVFVASTGVIGMPLSLEPFKTGIPTCSLNLGNTIEHSKSAIEGIMTTDTKPKSVAVEFEINGKTCKMGAMTKGSGMIAPDLATMLCFITTDACVSSKVLDYALKNVILDTFNMLSVDGDTSTNDTVLIFANGLAGNDEIISTTSNEYSEFYQALKYVTTSLVKMMAKDGEGATKLLVSHVTGAKTVLDARIVAKKVIQSSLLKAAIFGADANWGRVLCAIGYSKANVDITKVKVTFVSKAGSVLVCENGAGVEFSEEIAKKVLLEDEITIEIELNDGKEEASGYGCDLTYDYVKINGDYRS